MRLSQISENKQEIIRNLATSIFDLRDILNDQKAQDQLKILDKFLQDPTPEEWAETRWMVNNLLTTQKIPEDKIEGLTNLAKSSPEVVSAAVYDGGKEQAQGTPASKTAMNKHDRDKLKRALGPIGMVSSLSNLGDHGISTSKKKTLLKTIANRSDETVTAAKDELKHARPIKRF